MIWYNIKELEKRLFNENLCNKTAFNYLFIHLILFTLASYLPADKDPVWAVWVHLTISVAAVLWGVRKTFEINQNGDKREYFKRFISLSFVTAIRTVVVGLLFSLILVIVFLTVDHFMIPPVQISFWKEVAELVLYALLNVYYLHTLITSFRRVNAAPERTAVGVV